MKCLLSIRTLFFVLFSLVAVLPLSAQQVAKQGQEAQGEWSLRVYRYPSSELLGGFVSSEQGQLTAPVLPAVNASAEDVAKFLRRSHFVIDQHLKMMGVTLPPGSLATFDPKNKTLALRSTELTHQRMAALAAQAERAMPKLVSINLQIIEAEATAVNEAVKQVKAQADHAAAWTALDALVSQKKASYVGDLRMETKSGNRATAVRGEGRTYVTEMTVDETRRSSIAVEERGAGTRLELEPTIGADGETMELTYSLEHHYRAPHEHWDKISATGERVVETPNIDFYNAHVTTGITLLGGMTKLLGIWKPEEVAEPERASHLQAAFLKAHIVSLLPALDRRVEQLLREEGEKIEKTPTAPPPEPPGATKGIITRSFHITEELLTMGDAAGGAPAAAADPFAAGGAPMANEARLTMRITAVEILKSKGIPFPEGSSANYKPSTGELLVRNTPENMKLVEAYIASLKLHAPHNLATTVHIIEADAATIRRLVASTAATTDHTAAWQEVEQGIAQNKIRLLRSAFLESKSGMHSTFESGRELVYVSETSIGALEHSANTSNAPGGNDKDAKPSQTSISNVHVSNVAAPHFSSAAEMRLVGLRFEMEGTVGYSEPDAVELNTVINYDYTSPVVTDSSAQPDAKTIRPLNHSIQFHRAECTVSTTLASGTHRLLNVWKPEGTPEFEKADFLQAAFLSIDIVPVERAAKP